MRRESQVKGWAQLGHLFVSTRWFMCVRDLVVTWKSDHLAGVHSSLFLYFARGGYIPFSLKQTAPKRNETKRSEEKPKCAKRSKRNDTTRHETKLKMNRKVIVKRKVNKGSSLPYFVRTKSFQEFVRTKHPCALRTIS